MYTPEYRFFFSAGHKAKHSAGNKESEPLAKTETAVNLSKLGLFSSTNIKFYETGKNKAVRIPTTGHSCFEHDHSSQCDTRVNVTQKKPHYVIFS